MWTPALETNLQNALPPLIAGSVKRFRQDVRAEADRLVDREVRKCRTRLSRRAWKTVQKWCKWDDELPVLMPAGTRLYYRKGRTEIALVEAQPQVRILCFSDSLVKGTGPANAAAPLTKVQKFSLALPYVIFVFQLVDGLFVNAYVSFLDRPLRSLKERPLRPFLPNIDTDLRLCPAQELDMSKLVKNDLNQQVSYIQGIFWNSVYNEELSHTYWDYLNYFSNDSRLSSLSAWQVASMEDPLFVLDNVPWIAADDMNYGATILRLCEQDRSARGLEAELYDDIMEELVRDVRKTFEDTLEAATHKAAPQEAKTFVNEIRKVIENVPGPHP